MEGWQTAGRLAPRRRRHRRKGRLRRSTTPRRPQRTGVGPYDRVRLYAPNAADGGPRTDSEPGAHVSTRGLPGRESSYLPVSVDVPNTATHPVEQSGKTLFAASGTNAWLLCEFTATECAVPAGCT